MFNMCLCIQCYSFVYSVFSAFQLLFKRGELSVATSSEPAAKPHQFGTGADHLQARNVPLPCLKNRGVQKILLFTWLVPCWYVCSAVIRRPAPVLICRGDAK